MEKRLERAGGADDASKAEGIVRAPRSRSSRERADDPAPAVDPRERIMVALDVQDAATALELARSLRGIVGWMKVGMTLFYAEGPSIVRQLRSLGFKVFVDLKLHDIPHQVEGACKMLTRAGADMLTVHASGGEAILQAAMRSTAAAAAKFGTARPKVVAVTVLTSLDDAALALLGVSRSASEQVSLLAGVARDAGCDGVVCAPGEAAEVRDLLGPEAYVVTPGVRPTGEAAGDQARVATPLDAIKAGASHLVIGRPVTQAPDPASVARSIWKEIAQCK